jgi:hypothetical protein
MRPRRRGAVGGAGDGWRAWSSGDGAGSGGGVVAGAPAAATLYASREAAEGGEVAPADAPIGPSTS